MKAAQLKADSFELLFNIGKTYDALKDFRNAIAYYGKALQLDASSADAWAHQGAAHYDLGEYGQRSRAGTARSRWTRTSTFWRAIGCTRDCVCATGAIGGKSGRG